MSDAQFGVDEVTLPIKRTEGDTLEERLTANAYHNILPARYLQRDADGNVVERQEELFARVARNIALAEAVFEAEKRDVEVRVRPDQLKPDHPRRDELAAEVFGAGTTADADVETALTTHNVNKFAYETVVPELPDGVREHVESVAAEFRELMEQLAFVPNCVPPDSLVAASGGMKPIADIDPGERVYDDEDGLARVESKYQNGEKTVLEIRTESGYTVRATPEHYFRVITQRGEYEWRQVKELEPDDTLALQKNFLDNDGERPELSAVSTEPTAGRARGAFERPDIVTPELAEWLGLYIGDGTARESGVRVAFDGNDEDLARHWRDLTETLFGFEPTTAAHHDGACIVGAANRRDLFDFLDQNDLLKESSKTAEVPAAILQAGRTCVARFLAGLFEADGTVGERQIELYTHSERLKSQVQKLLLGLGIRASTSEKGDGYRISIRKNVCGKRFVERVGFISERKTAEARRFEEVAENASSVKIPNQTDRFHEWFKQSDLGLDAYRSLSQFLIPPDSEYHQQIGKGIFEQYAETYPELRDSPVAEHVERDQFYDHVSQITEVGTMAVEDMQVPRRNTYVVEGFVSHNSPTLMNAGDELQQLSACFVDSPGDDLTDIHQTAKEAAEVFQSGGGMGYAFWQLRPYGDPVGSTGGIASGPITFMRTYDQLCETIAQGGTRRGAQMGVMRVSHPDVIEFIHAKNKDVSLAHCLRLNDPDDHTYTAFSEALEEARGLIDDEGRVPEHLRNAVEGHLSNFNISVGVTDGFMEAVKAGEEFTFTNPRTGDPHVATEETKEMYSRYGLGDHVEVGEELSVPAEVVWERIVEGAHENGEPGVIYLERVNEQHSFDVDDHPDHRILATNPSLAAGTRVLTDQGIVDIEELECRQFEVPTLGGEWSRAVCHRSGDDEPLYEVELSNGKTYLATGEHKWPVLTDGEFTRTRTTEIEAGAHLPIARRDSLRYGSAGDYRDGFLVGWLYGDGNITERNDGRTQYGFTFSSEDAETGVMEAVLDRLEEIVGVRYTPNRRKRGGEPWFEVHASNEHLRTFMDEYGVDTKDSGVPSAIWNDASESFRKGFVDGLFSADGYVDADENRVILVSSHEPLVKDVSDLLGFYGLKTSLRKSETEKWESTYERWDLKLSRTQAHRFREVFDLTHERKAASLVELKEPDRDNVLSDNVVVRDVRPADERGPVWDLRVDEETHTFALSHAFTGNCGEQPLEEYEACNLGHINLSTLAARDAPDWRVWSERHADEYASLEAAVEAYLASAVDWEAFERRIELGTRFLENVVTMSDFPVPEIEQKVREMRKIGLGIMGLAQLYIQLGMRYGSDASNEVARQLMTHINHESKWASHELATERGVFEEWDNSKYADPTEYREWFERQTGLDAGEWADGFPVRNHNTTTIAPTGTTSMVGNTTGGCEPIYNVAYYKNVSDDVQGEEMLVEFDDYFLRVLEANGIDVADVKREAKEQMANNEFGGVESLETVPDAIGELFVTTGDLSAKQHAAVQCACQAGVDSAISKTVNAPSESTVADAKEVFEYIYDHGGKGVTYYRDGTRSKQVLTTRARNTEFAGMNEEEAAEVLVEHIEEVFGGVESFLDDENVRSYLEADVGELLGGSVDYAEKRPRPDALQGVSQRIDTGYGKLYVTINEDPETGEPFELFANIGHSGGFTNSFTEALAKVISTALRSGVDPEEIVDELEGTRSPKVAWDKGEQINSIPDAIGTAMGRYLDGAIDKPYPKQANLTEIEERTENRDATDPEPDGGAVAGPEGDMQSLIDAGESPECPECGAMTLYYAEGCKTCESCGWSEC